MKTAASILEKNSHLKVNEILESKPVIIGEFTVNANNLVTVSVEQAIAAMNELAKNVLDELENIISDSKDWDENSTPYFRSLQAYIKQLKAELQ